MSDSIGMTAGDTCCLNYLEDLEAWKELVRVDKDFLFRYEEGEEANII